MSVSLLLLWSLQMGFIQGPFPGASAVGSITSHGITWTFNGTPMAGLFVTGDWWVVDPGGGVVINSITPLPSKDGNLRYMNGTMKNVSIGDGTDLRRQGYDSELAEYVVALNAGRPGADLDISAANPLNLVSGDIIISTISVPAADRPQLQTAAVLTVLSSAPAVWRFRPGYCGSFVENKLLSDVDFTVIDTLQLNPDPFGANNMPALDDLIDQTKRPYIDHVEANGGFADNMHPIDNMRHYEADIARDLGNAGLATITNLNPDARHQLAINLIQIGLDCWSVQKEQVAVGLTASGTPTGFPLWVGGGGHSSFRLFPIVFAAHLLADAARKAEIIALEPAWFGENATTFWVTETAAGPPRVFNNGNGAYSIKEEGMPEWGTRHISLPSKDSGSWFVQRSGIPGQDRRRGFEFVDEYGNPSSNGTYPRGSPYRGCCTAAVWVGQALWARQVTGAKTTWGHDQFFDYMDRYLLGDWSDTQFGSGNSRVNGGAPRVYGEADHQHVQDRWIYEMFLEHWLP
jgi:hypothetical protein